MTTKVSWIVALLVIVVSIVCWWLISNKYNDNDFRLAFVTDKGVTLRSVSWQRRMVNEVVVDNDVYLWVPKGMGWYQSDKLRKLLLMEKKETLAADIMFFNFGFSPDVVIFDHDNWLTNMSVISKWGVLNVAKYWWYRLSIMVKEISVEGTLDEKNSILSQVAERDLSDSRVINDDLRLTLFNEGQSSGLATYISQILEWSGFNVVGVENAPPSNDGCLISYGPKSEIAYGFGLLKRYFSECQWAMNKDLQDKEIELYFGDKYSQMINYASYIHLP